MPRGRWFDLRDLPGYILQMEEKQKQGIILQEYGFRSGGDKSNIELTFVHQITDEQIRGIIEAFIESKNKVGLAILDESDFCAEKDPKCFEFTYKNYSVLVVFTNDTEFKPRQVYIKCHKYPL
jgi:hypothetical protein